MYIYAHGKVSRQIFNHSFLAARSGCIPRKKNRESVGAGGGEKAKKQFHFVESLFLPTENCHVACVCYILQ